MNGLLTYIETAEVLGVQARPGLENLAFGGVSTDTRTIKPGELFVAIRGDAFDGHDFIDKAFEAGAAAAVVSKTGLADEENRFYLRVSDTLYALGELAAHLRRRSGVKVAALTGSNGKTTTKEMLHRIIAGRFKTLATRGNFNNLVGLPLTLFGMRPDHEAAVLEMGMNAPGEIARLTEIADPDVGLITNVAPAHLEGLGSIQGVARAKGELFAGMKSGAAIAVNIDDPLVSEQAEQFKGTRITFGLNPEAMVRAADIETDSGGGIRFTLIAPGYGGEIVLPLLGRHNVVNTLAAVAAAVAFGIPADAVGPALNGFKAFPGRLELKSLPGGVVLIDDTYNANPASTMAALNVLTARRDSGRKIAALGDMRELGEASRSEHEKIGRAVAESGVDYLVAVGPNCRYMVETAVQTGMKQNALWFSSTEEAALRLKHELKEKDCLLVKGSRGMRMETIINILSGEAEV